MADTARRKQKLRILPFRSPTDALLIRTPDASRIRPMSEPTKPKPADTPSKPSKPQAAPAPTSPPAAAGSTNPQAAPPPDAGALKEMLRDGRAEIRAKAALGFAALVPPAPELALLLRDSDASV